MKSLSETPKTIDCREPGANNPRNKFPCSVGYRTQLSTAFLTVFCWLQDTTIDCVAYRVLLVTGHYYRLRCLPCSVGYRTQLSTALLTVFLCARAGTLGRCRSLGQDAPAPLPKSSQTPAAQLLVHRRSWYVLYVAFSTYTDNNDLWRSMFDSIMYQNLWNSCGIYN